MSWGDPILCKAQLVCSVESSETGSPEVWCFALCPNAASVTAEEAAELLRAFECGGCLCQLWWAHRDHSSDSCCDVSQS